ncbi:helix-hairpin-helix domain-containing protein, partial [Patescibacteria group bacterium]|nr:helix-hairpin-helix domain-containing protein [Patescibacteria group bacterium]
MKMHAGMTNAEISVLFEAVKAVLEIQGVSRYRVIAYDRAATSIEHLTTQLKDLWEDGQLDQVPGVGERIAGYLDELFDTGEVDHFKSLFAKVNPAFFEFLQLNGVGAKTALRLSEKLGVKQAQGALAKLERAAKSHKIKALAGFGAESERNILFSLKQLRSQPTKRLLLVEAGRVGSQLVDYLKKCSSIKRVEYLGSLRRRCATVG